MSLQLWVIELVSKKLFCSAFDYLQIFYFTIFFSGETKIKNTDTELCQQICSNFPNSKPITKNLNFRLKVDLIKVMTWLCNLPKITINFVEICQKFVHYFRKSPARVVAVLARCPISRIDDKLP